MFLTIALRQTNYMRRLFVGNLSWMTSEHQLRDYFIKFGVVKNIRLFFDHETGLSRQFAFVDFKTSDGANAALAKLSHTIDGRD
uniref:RRM domain-containing protein n=1 Tax=Romanomermis culicivorax TaxID=13658 RepID=A0A915HHM2_ROMCU